MLAQLFLFFTEGLLKGLLGGDGLGTQPPPGTVHTDPGKAPRGVQPHQER